MRTLQTIVLAILALLTTAAPAPAADTIKVGAVLAVTGPASFLGAPEARTLEMLAEELNAKGGINGRRIELIIKDSGASPEKAISFAKQLIEEEKVFAIIGPSTTGETMAIKNLAEESKTLLISCAAAEVIVNPLAKHVFKVAPSDKYAVEKIYHQMKKMGISKIGVLSTNTVTSLEVRAPWLDHRIIEFAFGRVPDRLKAFGGEKKILPRRLAARLLPPELDLRRKQGFSIPLHAWFAGEWGRYMEGVLEEAEPALFDRAALRALVANQRRGLLDANRIFAVTIFELWRREYRISL